MRVFSLSVLLISIGLFMPRSWTTAGETKLEPGFKALFNGKNLDGWQPMGKKEPLDGKAEAFKGRFKVKGDVIVIDYEMKGNAYLETTKEFSGDVHIKLDFKPGAECNNDFLFRGTKFDITLTLKGVKKGEWNTLEIIVAGKMMEHKINGETARKTTIEPKISDDAKKDEKALAKYKEALARSQRSPFVMRAEFGVIELKNIRIKE